VVPGGKIDQPENQQRLVLHQNPTSWLLVALSTNRASISVRRPCLHGVNPPAPPTGARTDNDGMNAPLDNPTPGAALA